MSIGGGTFPSSSLESHSIRRLARATRALAAEGFIRNSWKRSYSTASAHELEQPLAISLTSYPPRFKTLALTLKSLLAQSIRPSAIRLWIAGEDLALVPDEVRELRQWGLEIQLCHDIRSYKKIVPHLERYSDEIVVIADDDTYYGPDWLRHFVESFRPDAKEVLFSRGHSITFDTARQIRPYRDWQFDVQLKNASRTHVPTGIGGVMYKPGIFNADVINSRQFLRLCPTADDIWLFWMAALNGASFRKIGPRFRMINWLNSQASSLYATNASANDEQVRNMLLEYGSPFALASDSDPLDRIDEISK